MWIASVDRAQDAYPYATCSFGISAAMHRTPGSCWSVRMRKVRQQMCEASCRYSESLVWSDALRWPVSETIILPPCFTSVMGKGMLALAKSPLCNARMSDSAQRQATRDDMTRGFRDGGGQTISRSPAAPGASSRARPCGVRHGCPRGSSASRPCRPRTPGGWHTRPARGPRVGTGSSCSWPGSLQALDPPRIPERFGVVGDPI